VTPKIPRAIHRICNTFGKSTIQTLLERGICYSEKGWQGCMDGARTILCSTVRVRDVRISSVLIMVSTSSSLRGAISSRQSSSDTSILSPSACTYSVSNKKAVLLQRWLRDAPTKVNTSHTSITLGWLNSTGRYGRRCWMNIFSPKFLHVPLGVGGWHLGYEERRCWANCSHN